MKLSDAKLRKLKAGDRAYKLADGNGLYIYVSTNGSKLWRLKYRFARKEKTLSCGRYPEIGIAQARQRAMEARTLLSNAEDPGSSLPLLWQASKQEDHVDESGLFKTLAREWFDKAKGKWSKSHSERVKQRLNGRILQSLGDIPADQITAQDCLDVIRKVEADGALDVAGRVRGFMRNIFDYGIIAGKVRQNPAAPLVGVLQQRRVTHRKALDREELPGFIQALKRSHKIHPVTLAATWMQVYTFLRPGEIRHGLWNEIDWKEKLWRIPGARKHPYTGEPMLGMKMKHQGHVVPLSTQVLAQLKKLHEITGQYAFMFPGYHNYHKPISDNAVRMAIQKRLGFDSTAHGFRAVARTLLDEELGFRPDIIEHQLHHTVKDPNGRAYNRTTYLKQRIEMMQTWADFINGLDESV